MSNHMGASAFAPTTTNSAGAARTILRTPSAPRSFKENAKDSSQDRGNTTTTKHVLVPGANKGIGLAICERLLQQCSDVTVWLGSRDRSRGDEAADSLRQRLGEDARTKERLFVVPLDVMSDESVEKAVATKKGCRLYGIVNNAGIKKPGNVQEESIQVNYDGPRRINAAFLPQLQPSGRIVHLASDFLAPNFVAHCQDASLRRVLAEPWTLLVGGLTALDAIARDSENCGPKDDAYGFSKALVCAYTYLLAQ